MSAEDAGDAEADAGFSLVEILVVLALVSALAATIVMATSQFGSILRIDRQLETRLALQRTVGHLAALIEAAEAAPPSQQPSPEDRSPRGPFKGTSSEVRFLATTRRGAYLNGFRDVALRLEGAGMAKRLLQDMGPARPGERSSDGLETIELARDVVDLSFAYYGAQGEERAAVWQGEWSDPTRLPLAVSVRVSVRKDDTDLVATDIATLGSP